MKNSFLKSNSISILSLSFIAMLFSACSKSNDPVVKKTDTTTTPTTVNEIVTLSPTKALPNSAIYVQYSAFDQSAQYTGTINGVTALVDGIGNNQLSVEVPANATSGKVKLVAGKITYTSSTDLEIQTTTFSTINLGTTYMEHLAIDAAGNIYGESGNTISRVEPNGIIKTFAIVGTTQSRLWGIAVDAAGNVYATGQTDFVIYKITPAGTVSKLAGSGVSGYADGQGTAAQFAAPIGLAIDGSGNLYVNDSHRVREISPSGNVITLAGNANDGHNDGSGANASFGDLEGIAADSVGNVYVADHKYMSIRKIFAGGGGFVTTIAGMSGATGFNDGDVGNSQFTFPQGLAVDKNSDVFVADNFYNAANYDASIWSVRMVNRLDHTTTFLKNTQTATGVSAVNFTDGIAFDKQGNMYISNTGTNTITMVTIK